MATLTELEQQHAELGAKIEAARAELREHAALQIKALMAEFQVTAADLAEGTVTPTVKAAKPAKAAKAVKAPAKAAKPAKKAAKAPKAKANGVARSPSGRLKGPQPPKYQDPTTGATWTGFGPAPTWIKEVEDRSQFLIAA